MTVGERLKAAMRVSGSSVRRLERDLKARGTRSASYASLHRYLRNTQHPPADVLADIADVLGARAAWLLTGDGPRTDADAAAQHERQAELLDPDRHHWPYIRGLDLGEGKARDSRERALIRFSQMLDDISYLDERFYDVAKRATLIQAAASFLMDVERALETALETEMTHTTEWGARPLVAAGLLRGEMRSGAELLAWHDAALDLFRRRVVAEASE
jgi:transcriptional regulator with XRE-family HTH domain